MEELTLGWFGLGLALLLLALVVALRARLFWSQSGLPSGQMLYDDTGVGRIEQPALYDHQLGLVGRPDYLIEENDGGIIPVELKSSKSPRVPYEGHILQLAAYCALVEAHFQVRPAYGILQYEDRAFAVDYTPELEDDLLLLLDEIDRDRYARELDRSHDEPKRCARCGFRDNCTDSLS